MRFLLMIFDDAAAWAKVPPSEMEQVMQTHVKLRADLEAAGQWVGCERLRPHGEAVTVREEESRHVVADGPFAETKEVMGGFYLIDCPSRADAVAWAKRLPLGGRSTVEVRPIWEMA
jgi:hypothetical protein